MHQYQKYDSHLMHFHTASDQQERATFMRRWPTFYNQFLPTNKTAHILDVGCGLGHFLYLLKELGYTNFLGIDLAAENIAHVRANIAPSAVQADAFEHLAQHPETYDFIHLKDVIEHIPQERLIEFANLLLTALKPGGQVMIGTANATHPMGRYLHYSDITHTLGALTEPSIRQLLTAAGFGQIRFAATNLPLNRTSFLGWLKRVLYWAPSHLLMKAKYKLEGIRPLPTVYHWHITIIATRPPRV